MKTYRGVVKNGVIFLSEDVRLPDGTVVEVRLITPSERAAAIDRLLANRITKPVGMEEIIAEDKCQQEERVEQWFSS